MLFRASNWVQGWPTQWGQIWFWITLAKLNIFGWNFIGVLKKPWGFIGYMKFQIRYCVAYDVLKIGRFFTKNQVASSNIRLQLAAYQQCFDGNLRGVFGLTLWREYNETCCLQRWSESIIPEMGRLTVWHQNLSNGWKWPKIWCSAVFRCFTPR